MDSKILGLLACVVAAGGWQRHREDVPALRLKEEQMTLEYTASADEAVIKLKAESERSLGDVEILSPTGECVLRLSVEGTGELALSGFVVETAEAPPLELTRLYPEGFYDLRARSTDGEPVVGLASLSHVLLPEPVIHYPREGMVDVPSRDLTVSWAPDPAAVGYRVMLEQGDNDGLAVELPKGSRSFQVPPGVLRPRTRTMLEIGAIAPGGNTTLVEVSFETQ